MLVLSRKTGQSIEIGDEITVNVTEIKGNRVRISILAPRHVLILRSELTTEGDGGQETPLQIGGDSVDRTRCSIESPHHRNAINFNNVW